jgi:tetratricopeptide (TPR) repeat protein
LKRVFVIFVGLLLAVSTALAQTRAGSKLLVVMPFENVSEVPGIDWIGESFPEVLGPRLLSANTYVISRSDRLYAFDRLGIPANSRPSRATLYHIAEEIDVDYVVTGKYHFDGRTFTARAQILDMKRLRLSKEAVESGALTQLLDIQNALAWDLVRNVDPHLTVAKNTFVAASAPVRLDALENLIRGVIASDTSERIKFLKLATRVNPQYAEANFLLGKTYFDLKDYGSATLWLAKVPRTDLLANEANFYLGLALYYTGNFDKAEDAFSFVSSRLPLTEVYNNLGVVSARRGKKTSVEHFQRAVAADPRDADYRFNYGLGLYRNGDITAAQRQLKEAAALRPQDSEIKSTFDLASTGAPLPLQAPTATGNPVRVPLERIKRNYDEASYRQVALEIQNAREVRLANLPHIEHVSAHVDRGNLLLSQDRNDEAEAEYREAVLLDPTTANGHLGLARVLEAKNDLAAARSEAMAAVQLRGSADAYLMLAHIDLKQNLLDAAQVNLNRALKLDPAHEGVPALQRAIAAKQSEQTHSEVKP